MHSIDNISITLDASGNAKVADASGATVLPTGATTALSLAEWHEALYDVRGKDAKNDGTTDNTTPFNNALNAVGVPGAYFIPPGKWNVTFAPAATKTTPVCFMLGANLLGNGFIEGNTDGSALGNVTGENSCGAAFIQALGDGYDQSVLAVQSDMPDWAGATNVQKDGIYVNVRNHQVSDAAGTTPYSKDSVAVTGFAEIGANNPQGRVWAANFVASCPSGADGQMNGIEVSVQNNGLTVGAVSGAFGKIGIGVYSQGATKAVSGVEIGSGFEYGITFLGTNGTYTWQQISPSGVLLSYLDIQGNLKTTTIQTEGYTVSTLPAGQAGMRAHVTDAASPAFMQPLTGGGSTTCPAFYNGTAWVAG